MTDHYASHFSGFACRLLPHIPTALHTVTMETREWGVHFFFVKIYIFVLRDLGLEEDKWLTVIFDLLICTFLCTHIFIINNTCCCICVSLSFALLGSHFSQVLLSSLFVHLRDGRLGD